MITDGPTRPRDANDPSESRRRQGRPVSTPEPERKLEQGAGPVGSASSIPALAFGSGLTALGVLRALRGSGIEVYSACPAGDLASKSRWFRPAPLLHGKVPEPEQLAEYLDRLPLDRAVLFPCSDDWTRAISELSGPLRNRFPACISEAKVIDTMTDKWRFSTFVECLNIPRPDTRRVDSLEQLEALDPSCFENRFLKPIDSQEFSRRNRAKAFPVENKRHALELMARVMREGGSGFPILLQEFIPGPPTRAYIIDGFIDRHCNLRALVARHRISQYPPRFGNTARCETVPLKDAAQAINSLRKMWSTVTYRGIFSAEFKYDERDGQLKILEVNARPWWYVEFTNRCGVDVCRMSYLDALDLPVDTIHEYKIGRECIHASYDLASYLKEEPGLGGAWRWFRSSLATEDIVFRWSDPWPGVRTMASALRTYVRRRAQSS